VTIRELIGEMYVEKSTELMTVVKVVELDETEPT